MLTAEYCPCSGRNEMIGEGPEGEGSRLGLFVVFPLLRFEIRALPRQLGTIAPNFLGTF